MTDALLTHAELDRLAAPYREPTNPNETPPLLVRLIDDLIETRELLEKWFYATVIAVTAPCPICNAGPNEPCDDSCPVPLTADYLAAAGVEVPA